MAQFFHIHTDNPQLRLVQQTVDILKRGGVIVYPTDSCYALGCHIGDKEAAMRLLSVRGLDSGHDLTLICRDLSELGRYAQVGNTQFRHLKTHTPGPYTFILRGTREVPKRLLHKKHDTIGLRVPDHPVVQAILAELGEPILSSTLLLYGDDVPLTEPWEIRERLEHQVDLVIDGGACGLTPTTVVDLTTDTPVVLRYGKGDASSFED
ncbi:threonylcarbamoyl-AMP synthase [Betaproteobacteria bacterium SCN1]|jgi:tRNA threonylcarbamoyl adenosine modification protein (Sua5/YciO/YrdC/YwlC family)|nr:threonylcarbamoyl-AMP synthase [Betaproteobacteria bacterium SCN1]MBN8761401.1 threonylcarbamoyl-AMP synthase [Thiobacillus sp.]ODU89222.1 MAG: threonylcarbamoyl-AMP synthase [Thiobacillus sp. SCN 65-179]OJW34535.1 MAG: threonylcarbamoyl-AMP synthase [Thiobacillus sp. 65-69]